MRYLFFLSLLLFNVTISSSAELLASGTRIHLTATAETERVNDEVQVTFRIEKEGRNSDKVRRFVNQVSADIQRQLQQENGLQQQTISRHMQAVWRYPEHQAAVRTGWRMVQVERITSQDLDALPHWLEAIEKQGAILNHVQFRVSQRAMQEAESELRQQVMQRFLSQASELTQAIGGERFHLITLHAHQVNAQPQQQAKTLMLRASATMQDAPPALSSGRGHLRMRVSGDIEVPLHDFEVLSVKPTE